MLEASPTLPYTTMIKELVETLILLQVKAPIINNRKLMGKINTLLNNEVDLQISFQNDIISTYKEEKAKKGIKQVNTDVYPFKKK